MRWLKREIWKTGIAFAGMLLLLVFMVWVPVSVAGAYEGASGFATPGMVQVTPTVDATVTALNKEKLEQEVEQLQELNAPDFFGWLQTNAAILLSTLVVVIGGLIGLFRWFGDRRSEREKRVEERFQSAVTGLGDEKEGARIGAAILLRTFLRPGYEQFYQQSFDLAVAHLRLRQVNTNEPIDSLSQALIRVFTESAALIRKELGLRDPLEYKKYLDAAYIRLDGAYLARVNLQNVWMRDVSFIGANLHFTNFRESDLIRADFHNADLEGADLSKASLRKAKFGKTILMWVNLKGADLYGADLSEAKLLYGADLSEANPTGTILKGTKLHGVKGLTKEQLEACKAKGAIIDEDSTTSSSQSPVSPPPPSQNDGVQPQSASPAQERRPIVDTGGSGAPSSSKPDPES